MGTRRRRPFRHLPDRGSTLGAHLSTRRRLVFAGLAAVAVLGTITYVLRPVPAMKPEIRSLAMLPLENLSSDPAQEYFADGMTEALIGNLARIRALRVVSRTSVMRFKGSRTPLPEIARVLNVDAVIEGSVQRTGDRVRIALQLIHAPTDTHLWAREYERELTDILKLQSEVARAVAEEIRIQVTAEERARMASSGTRQPIRLSGISTRTIPPLEADRGTLGPGGRSLRAGDTPRSRVRFRIRRPIPRMVVARCLGSENPEGSGDPVTCCCAKGPGTRSAAR